MSKTRFTGRTLATGKVCFCSYCAAQPPIVATTPPRAAGMVTTSAPPEPPSLVDTLRAKRNLAPLVDAPLHRPNSFVAAAEGTVAPDPPSLIEAIQRKGAAR